ncbi:MAG: tRNA pseudouridine(55) synthase TruB [Candidatus Pacebacteria bacterium]|jgi:tRNA pseudouridine55 synthase|nr:tRNA pseudouridine(55) synthase TruB [Candidatus Paceibacterota bacterium]MBT3512100.1 tRNA pseudouridine(55) synthase TruB [Candidatus Paceibacterota bacterium]MBT4005219.1 tRNA pseudouridine(55) synthase TruB [Candidatus Paceibacterota bacterium]MBT4358363.1 tRNA pseudouridine(55) synthase TruB [Candidatus Paceibacterota bacterium]MBT4680779.1 tRNA pseudouridine(55) synthase TruB [Candidatus Paceibacterota bacterium]
MRIGLSGNPPAGILLIDKPTGITSHDVVYKVRKKTGVKRVGHAGTLDPLATGLLIVLVGREFTKRQSEFLKQDKEYLCEVQLGIETDTYDVDGQIIKEADWENLVRISKEDVEKVLDQFRGQISQTVPAFSAVKVKGRKLYEKARKGEIDKKDLPSREVHIKELEPIDLKKDEVAQEMFFNIRVACSSGTYIRSLAHDIGQELGVGATVKELRRTKIGELKLEDSTPLQGFVA